MNRAAEIAEVTSTHRIRLPELGLALACFVGSAATVQKYAGTVSVVLYLLVLVGAVPLLVRGADLYFPALRTRSVALLACATLLVLAIVFALVYPHANTHVPGLGSDRDDAADMGARALLHGRWPYHGHTYLGNPISQLPGLLVLAVPFEALGHSAYAAFFWLPVLFAVLWYLRGEAQSPLLLLWLVLVASPVVVREVLTGGDLVANTVSVMLALCLVHLALLRGHTAGIALASLFLGFVLSSRLNFLFVLPPLVALVWRRYGARVTTAHLTLTAVGFAAVTLPFYIGRRSFPPLAASDHLSVFDRSFSGGQWLLIGLALVLSAILAVLAPPTLQSVFVQAAILQAFFLVAVAVHDSVSSGALDLVKLTPGYGLPVVLLALGAVPALDRACVARRPASAAYQPVDSTT